MNRNARPYKDSAVARSGMVGLQHPVQDLAETSSAIWSLVCKGGSRTGRCLATRSVTSAESLRDNCLLTRLTKLSPAGGVT